MTDRCYAVSAGCFFCWDRPARKAHPRTGKEQRSVFVCPQVTNHHGGADARIFLQTAKKWSSEWQKISRKALIFGNKVSTLVKNQRFRIGGRMKRLCCALFIVLVCIFTFSEQKVEAGSGWSKSYISSLSTQDCKGIAARDKSYCKTADCKGIASGEKSYCKTSDCKGVASGERSYCSSSLCKGWATKNKSYCDSADCKGVATGQKSYCQSKQCKAIAAKDKSYCP